MPPPRLLIIGPTPPPYSGPEVCTAALLQASSLNEAFHIDHVETSLRDSNADRGRVDLTAARAFLRFVRDVHEAVGRRPALVYQMLGTNWTGLARDLTSILLARRAGIPVVAQVRGGHFVARYRTMSRPGRWLVRSGLRRLSRLLVEGQAIRSTFQGIVPLGKIDVVRHPVPDVAQAACLTASDDARPVRILFVGHRSIGKGWLDLLRALEGPTGPRGAPPEPDWRLTAIGTRITRERNVLLPSRVHRDDQREIDRLEAALGHRLELLGGQVTGDAKARAFAQADLFVLPSYSEGLSVAVCEALRAGLPVITTPVGALGEVVREGVGGYLIPPGNVPALADALVRLLGDPEARAQMGRANRDAAAEWFDEERVTADYVSIFEGVVAQDPGTSG